MAYYRDDRDVEAHNLAVWDKLVSERESLRARVKELEEALEAAKATLDCLNKFDDDHQPTMCASGSTSPSPCDYHTG